jgi:Replication-relaxation
MSSSLFVPVTDREAHVLQHLWRLRFLTAVQVTELVFSGSGLTARSQEEMTRRLLSSLKRRGLVATMPRSVGGPLAGEVRPVYYLTAEGLATARSLWPGPSPRKLRSSGTFLARHAIATAQVVLAFRRAALANPAHELVGWECDWQAALPLGSRLVEPDAYLLYRVGERRLHAFLEIDMATEHTRLIAMKVRRYLDVHRGGSWRVRFTVWPLVLVIAETESRVTQLRRVTEAVAAMAGGEWDSGASFRFATLAAVTGAQGPLGAIWQPLGSAERAALIANAQPREEVER